jgi:hypothetical protein
MRWKDFILCRPLSFMTYKGLYYLIHGCISRWCVAPSFAMNFLQARLQAIIFFFHVLRNELKANFLPWCQDNDIVTHKFLAQMKSMARDETPFLSVL